MTQWVPTAALVITHHFPSWTSISICLSMLLGMMGKKQLTWFIYFSLLKTTEFNVHVDLKRSNKMTTYGNTGLNTQKYGTLKDKEVTLKAHTLCSHYLQGHPRPCRLLRRSGVKRSKWYDKQRGQGKTLYNVTPTPKAGTTLLVTPVTFTWTHQATEGERYPHSLKQTSAHYTQCSINPLPNHLPASLWANTISQTLAVAAYT